ncbi:MAG: FtsX-like permease family protein [Saprospiraceae bacterium]|nr:FtsX-like permease family protein [Saprospiraceae bacterium]
MRLPLLAAWRYLFSKKSTNAINIITGISIVGIGVGTAALLLVLSVFNGFEELLAGLMNSVNADIKVTLVRGKTFEIDSAAIARITEIDGVESVSLTLEETALIEYDGKQDFCVLKGVEDHYNLTTTIDSALIDGEFKLRELGFQYLIMGGGIANRLNVNLNDPFEPVAVYMPKQRVRSPAEPAFRKRLAYPRGKFSIKQDYDYRYVFASLEFVQELLERPGEASAIEIRTARNTGQQGIKQAVAAVLGEAYDVKDRYEQNDALFKLMQIEKWLSYAIAGLTLFIVSFNLVGALWMIVLDKKQDLSILRAMGATARQIRDLILYEGLLVSGLGVMLGVLVAVIAFLLQRHYGLVGVPEGFVIDAYPIVLRLTDFLIVCLTVLSIGALSSILPARKASLIPAYVREE